MGSLRSLLGLLGCERIKELLGGLSIYPFIQIKSKEQQSLSLEGISTCSSTEVKQPNTLVSRASKAQSLQQVFDVHLLVSTAIFSRSFI